MRQRLLVAALASIASVGLAGCESTQTKSARAAKAAGSGPVEETSPFGAMDGASGDVKVDKDVTLLSDEIGTAAVVQLKNTGKKDAFEVPVLLKVAGDDGAEVYTNATPGIQRSLTHAAVVPAGEETFWVNDQIPLTGGIGKAIEATAGAAEGKAAATEVKYRLTTPALEQDPADGFVAKGYLQHDAPEEQKRVLVTVIGRKGGEIVAAGRGVVARAKSGKRSRYVVFFIGKPEGAELTATAQPDIDSE